MWQSKCQIRCHSCESRWGLEGPNIFHLSHLNITLFKGDGLRETLLIQEAYPLFLPCGPASISHPLTLRMKAEKGKERQGGPKCLFLVDLPCSLSAQGGECKWIVWHEEVKENGGVSLL
jgi:hypothetical protein